MVTTYGKNLFMDHLFHTPNNPSLPATYYLGLSTTAPTEAGGNFTEPSSGTGYGRIAISGLTNAVNGVVQNGTVLSFAESTNNQGTVTHWGIFPEASNGSLIMYGPLNKSRIVEGETILSIKTGSLKLELVNEI